jgi:diguanylate cyclase (GGDEF)-like protein
MNLAFLPDLLALTILIVILLVLRRRHPQEKADIWLLGLFFTLVEAVAHTFYAPIGIPAKALHVIVVDCYLIAGLIFTWTSGELPIPRKVRLLYLVLNSLPLLALTTTYGLNIRTPVPYLPIAIIGLIIGVTTSLYLRRNWYLVALHLFGWLTIAFITHNGGYREAVYWSLSCVYTIAAISFQHRLPRASTGKLAILTGFSIWALSFLLHPWIVHFPAYADIASHVWNMQKSLISIGMILVMLEEQVSSNEWLALHDELTGLPNRRLFADRLAIAIERSRRTRNTLALLVLYLDGLKKINDSLGHHAGDLVLREVANNLRRSVRASDTLARLGGDEFIIVASDLAGGNSIDHFVEAIHTAVEKPLLIDGQTMSISASLGVAIFPTDTEDAIKLVRIADQRMYALKHKAKTQPAQSPSRPDLTRSAH